MKSPRLLLIIFFFTSSASSFSQKLKKADRITAANVESHVNYLSDEKLKGRTAGSEGERIAEEYIVRQFQKTGCKPMGDSSNWFQKFNINDGKEIAATSRFLINGRELKLYTDYFPFSFSASKKTEAAVSMELAENGVPWFVELKDLLDNEDGTPTKDTSALISSKATHAASKGATALIVYNNSELKDLQFNAKDAVQTAKIPVVYINKPAQRKHLSRESIDVKLNIQLKDKSRIGSNVLGYSDNHADSTILIGAHLDAEKDVAALLELSRLLKGRPYKSWNYLFTVYSGEKNGADGINYFNDHPVINLQKVNYTLNLDTVESKGLPAVKQSILAINALRSHETKTRP
jgi:hypothetical protein